MQVNYPKTKLLPAFATAALLLLSDSAFAQSAAPASSTTGAQDQDEEVVVLSPFVVDSSQDKGYRATSTLAGSRINTQLRDVAQSITVLTKEFMNDIDAVDVNDILAFTANTEGTRDFTVANVSLGAPSDDVAANRNGSNRIRGSRRPISPAIISTRSAPTTVSIRITWTKSPSTAARIRSWRAWDRRQVSSTSPRSSRTLRETATRSRFASAVGATLARR